MREKFEEVNLTENQKILNKFNDFFPEGKARELDIEDLPENILNFFENNSRRFILPEEYKPGDFKRFMLINHENGDKTYIANQIKNYSHEEGGREDLNYLIDCRDDENIGHAELRYNLSSSEKSLMGKPFVGFTATEEKYQRSGLGRRRLFLMNALSKTLYNSPLYSDTLISDEAQGLWEKLVEEGLAKKIEEENNSRYVLID